MPTRRELRLTTDCTNWLVGRAGLVLVSHSPIKANVFAECVGCWLAAGCAIAEACVHLLSLNVQATCKVPAINVEYFCTTSLYTSCLLTKSCNCNLLINTAE